MRGFLVGMGLSLSLALASPALAVAPPVSDATGSDWKESYAYMVGMQAVFFGYPIVKNATVRYQMIEKPNGQADMPLNTWFHSRRPSDATDKLHSSVTPDLLYSAAWFDLSAGPVVITVPDAADQYYSIQMMEMYSDIFAYLGTRASGGKAGHHLLVGPTWSGPVPEGIDTVITAPQNQGMLLLRAGIADRRYLKPTHKVQDGVRLTPFSKWRTNDATPETNRDVVDPAGPGTPLSFVVTMNRAMTQTPPPPKDASFVAWIKSVGLGPNMASDFSEMDPATKKGLQRALTDGLDLLRRIAVAGGKTKIVNNWAYGQKDWGRTGETHDFLTRAANQSFSGMQEHWIEEVVKLRAHHDAAGELLDGRAQNYILHFGPGELPNAKAFWSIVVYDENYDLVDNSVGRYSLGSLDKNLRYGKDGSLTLYLQATPAKVRSNWLPIPQGKFNLFLRAYLPGQALIDQDYAPPAVRKAP